MLTLTLIMSSLTMLFFQGQLYRWECVNESAKKFQDWSTILLVALSKLIHVNSNSWCSVQYDFSSNIKILWWYSIKVLFLMSWQYQRSFVLQPHELIKARYTNSSIIYPINFLKITESLYNLSMRDATAEVSPGV